MCFTKEAKCGTQRKMRKIQTIITAELLIVPVILGKKDWLAQDSVLRRLAGSL